MFSTVARKPWLAILPLLWLPRAALADCGRGSPEHEAARVRFRDLDSRLDAPFDNGALPALKKELEALLATPCFTLSVENSRRLDVKSALAFRTWWKDGGADWVGSYLPRDLGGDPPTVVIPPDFRRSLALDDNPGHPLAALLCPSTDASCGAETRGWLLRAERAFSLAPASWLGPAHDAKNLPENTCVQKARGEKASYRAWRLCQEDHRPRRAALPLGSFSAPKNGWLVLRGRRGHYGYCDELRFYDLSTGAAHLARRCTSLMQKKPDAVANVEVKTGLLPLENLREAALMLLIADEAERRVQVHSVAIKVPDGLALLWTVPRDFAVFGSGSGSSWASSDQTSLAYSFFLADLSPGKRPLAEGALTWPQSANPGSSYAAELIQIAEAGFAEGAVAPLPESLLVPAPGGSRKDASAELLEALRRRK